MPGESPVEVVSEVGDLVEGRVEVQAAAQSAQRNSSSVR